MRIALIASPFIELPPRRYGGTELFVANLARELWARGEGVTVYGNGDSHLPCATKWRYERSDWPIDHGLKAHLKNADHTAWAIDDASGASDLLHLNDVVGIPMTRFVDRPIVHTIHHPHDPIMSEHYLKYANVHYVAIAHWLARAEPMPHVHVVHHGIPTSDYTFSEGKDDYVLFLGRMAPCKGPHLAIRAARRAGIRLKLVGEIQPPFRDYWDRDVAPQVDGDQIEYVGEADFGTKNVLLSRARALLFPIQWDEPFGLIMIEAMACGTPVLAFAGGSVEEIVRNGVNGWICTDVEEMAGRIASPDVAASACRDSVETLFSVAKMADGYLNVYARAAAGSAKSRIPASKA